MTPTHRVPQFQQIAAERPNDPCEEKKMMIRAVVKAPAFTPLALILALAALLLGAAPIQAQNLFAPRVYVNDRAITEFEVQQRVQMLRLFQTQGDLEKEALKALIEDRLRMSAAKALKITATPEQIMGGMEEFASRANLTAEQFVAALGQAGVSAETFRDFVQAGLVWREVVRATYVGRISVSDAEVDRVLAKGDGTTGVRVLVSELVIPAPAGQEKAALDRANRIRSQITSESSFAASARRNSAAATAGRGGRLEWMPLANLPAALTPVILGLAPGEVSQPVNMGGAVGLFQLRAIEKPNGPGVGSVNVDYAQYSLPAATGAAEAATIRAKVDTCNDLYAIAKGQPADRLIRETKPASTLPTNTGRALASLDPGESVDFPSGAAHVFLMLCARNPVADDSATRDSMREKLINEQLAAKAQSLLEELRFDAIIREP
ncbi:peptidylprolyl isomerase [Pseudorhodobacter ferrugineus]|uniref:peptidylprolyl isomerase n=1 Tax=Pseudorhodobacter ferrugineus TaxID=77008 RepID=UPI000400CF92|nr:peptidylprolyl isomerase [Pseudorhodobacter ferrugineus]